MFTDGLDNSALQWVREGTKVNSSEPPKRVPPPAPAAMAYRGLSPVMTKPWGLPPTQLPKAHLHSALLTPPLSSTMDDLDESVGSASGGREYDYYDDESVDSDEQDSENPVDANLVNKLHGMHLPASIANEYYYEQDKRTSLGSKPNSKPGSRRESFGRAESKPWPKVRRSAEQEFHSDEDTDRVETNPRRGLHSEEEDESSENGVRYVYDRQATYEHSSSSVQTGEGNADEVPSIPNIERYRNSYFQGHGWFPQPENFQHDSGIENEEPVSSPDKVGVPPSAPPMTSSGVAETSAEVSSHMPGQPISHTYGRAFEVTQDSEIGNSDDVTQPRTAYSFETTQRHGVSLQPEISGRAGSTAAVVEESSATSFKKAATTVAQPAPVFLSGHAAWQAIIAYDACVRLCLRAWARGCVEAPDFLRDECLFLRNAFGLQSLLLQPHEELIRRSVADEAEVTGSSSSKPRRDLGNIKVQVKRVRVIARRPLRSVSSQRGIAYVQAGAQYVKQVSDLLKAGVTTLRNTAMAEPSQELYTCLLRLKSTPETEAVRLQAGSGEMHIFHPDSSGDDLILDVQDSSGCLLGRVSIQHISLNDDLNDRVRWWPLYNEPEHECVGKVQLFIDYSVNCGEVNPTKWGPVGETQAYDIVLEVAMRAEQWGQRNLRLCGPWRWLLSEFAVFYGVSDAYANLRYLSCTMEVATPTEDCLLLVYELLCPIVKTRDENRLNRQEKRILLDVEEQVEQLLALIFENYKSLDESSPTGLSEVFSAAVGKGAPVLEPAVKVFTLLHDILSSEAQLLLRTYFQTAAKKRCRRHMAETDEFVSSNSEGFLMDPMTISTSYSKMKALCALICNEVRSDIDIHNEHVLPSSVDLSNIAAGIYSVELSNRLRAFLASCPPSGPSQCVVELLLATADFQRDLSSRNISVIKGGVDAKDLFHLYIVLWIQDKRLHLLDFCKLDKVRWTGVTTQHGTSPFVEEMYERIKDMLNEYDVIVNRWPEYTFTLESAVADVEVAIIAALEKQYAEILAPLKDIMVPKKFTLQYMQKLTRRRALAIYSVPNQLGVFLNTIKRLLDILRPKIEVQMKSWVACLPVEVGGKMGFGERLNEVTVTLRTKYKNFVQAIVEKLADNARMQRTTKLKRILQDTREAGGESEIRERMQPLNNQLMDTISHLHDVFSGRVFVAICRGYWDRMGRDVLQFLENRKENRTWYKGPSFALTILDDIFISQMQRLQGHALLQDKDLEPPRAVMEAHSMLSKDAPNGLDSSNYFYY